VFTPAPDNGCGGCKCVLYTTPASTRRLYCTFVSTGTCRSRCAFICGWRSHLCTNAPFFHSEIRSSARLVGSMTRAKGSSGASQPMAMALASARREHLDGCGSQGGGGGGGGGLGPCDCGGVPFYECTIEKTNGGFGMMIGTDCTVTAFNGEPSAGREAGYGTLGPLPQPPASCLLGCIATALLRQR
jgi:hypothetical protein